LLLLKRIRSTCHLILENSTRGCALLRGAIPSIYPFSLLFGPMVSSRRPMGRTNITKDVSNKESDKTFNTSGLEKQRRLAKLCGADNMRRKKNEANEKDSTYKEEAMQGFQGSILKSRLAKKGTSEQEISRMEAKVQMFSNFEKQDWRKTRDYDTLISKFMPEPSKKLDLMSRVKNPMLTFSQEKSVSNETFTPNMWNETKQSYMNDRKQYQQGVSRSLSSNNIKGQMFTPFYRDECPEHKFSGCSTQRELKLLRKERDCNTQPNNSIDSNHRFSRVNSITQLNNINSIAKNF